jgi:hypothetical protein
MLTAVSFPHRLINTVTCGGLEVLTAVVMTVAIFWVNTSDQVSHPCATKGKIIVLHVLIFNFLATDE